MTKISEPITLDKLWPLIQKLSQSEQKQLRELLETDSDAWRKKWQEISAHFHDAFANTPEDEVIRDFDAALGEVRRDRSGNLTE